MKYNLTIKDVTFNIKAINKDEAIKIAEQFIHICDEDDGLVYLRENKPIKASSNNEEDIDIKTWTRKSDRDQPMIYGCLLYTSPSPRDS